MIARVGCLVLSLLALGAGMAQASVALVVLGSVLAVMSFRYLGAPDDDAERVARVRSGGDWRSLSATATGLAVGAGLLSLVAVCLSLAYVLTGLAVTAWVLAFGVLVALGLCLDDLSLVDMWASARSAFSSRHRPEIGSVLAIMVVALVLRVYNLEMAPPALHGDEGELGLIALRIVRGEHVPFFRLAPFWGPAYPFAYLQAGVIWLLGPTATSVRIVSALTGVLCVPVVYGIGRLGWGPIAGAMAAWLLAVSHFHLQYSRLGQTFMLATLLVSLTMLLLALTAHDAQRRVVSGGEPHPSGGGLWSGLLLTGAVAGLSQQVSYAAVVVPVIVGVLLLYLLRAGWLGRWHAAAVIFAFLVIDAPLLASYLTTSAEVAVRLHDWSAFRVGYVHDVVGPDATLPSALPALLLEQTRRTLAVFVRSGDDSGFYLASLPMFDVVTATLFWLGLGAAIGRADRFHEAALLIWLGAGLLLGSILALGAASGPRILMVAPVAYLLGGVALARLWEIVRAAPLGRADGLIVPGGTALALWLVTANVASYFYVYLPTDENAEATEMAREMEQEQGQYRYYFLTDPRFDPNAGAVRYLAYGTTAENLKQAADFSPPPPDGRGILVFALEPHLGDLRAIEQRLPGGEEQRRNAPNGRLLYVSYRVPPSR